MIYNYQLSLVLCQQFRSPSLAEGSWQRKQARERSAFVVSAFSPYFHSRYSQANRTASSKDSSTVFLIDRR